MMRKKVKLGPPAIRKAGFLSENGISVIRNAYAPERTGKKDLPTRLQGRYAPTYTKVPEVS
jgi:hypothetical protein